MRFDASLTFLFPGVPLLERFARASAAGFEAVEVQDLEGVDPHRLAAAARAAGVEVVLINAPAGDLASGGPGLSGVPGREAEFREAVTNAAFAACSLGCTRVHVGPSRAPPNGSRAAAVDTLVRNLHWAGEFLGQRGVCALVEAINPFDAPGVLVDHVELALEVIERVNHPKVRLSFDAYHVARCGEDPVSWLKRCAPLLAHVQVADCPGRGAPGTGRMPFAEIFSALAAMPYAGWIGAEYRPADESQATLEWLLRSIVAAK